MNMIVEVIDGTAYVVDGADTSEEACNKCFFTDKECDGWCAQQHSLTTYYRRLTAEERVELQKAIGRGI